MSQINSSKAEAQKSVRTGPSAELTASLNTLGDAAGDALRRAAIMPSLQLLNALFSGDDLIEIRVIETWQECGKRQSELRYRAWSNLDELKGVIPRLQRLNQTADVFFGVNPRTEEGGTKAAVRECCSVWADFDHIATEEVLQRCETLGLPPSLVIESGHGVHTYWLLEERFAVEHIDERSRFEDMLRRFYKSIGSDSTCDVTRLLRIPGFRNNKNLRNGAESEDCSLLLCDATVRYPASLFFDRWPPDQQRPHSPCRPSIGPDRRLAHRIQGLVRYLDNDVPDRSTRDFGVVAGLLRLGLNSEEIWALVASHSKFAGPHGESYFNTTLKNALKAVGGEDFFD